MKGYDTGLDKTTLNIYYTSMLSNRGIAINSPVGLTLSVLK